MKSSARESVGNNKPQRNLVDVWPEPVFVNVYEAQEPSPGFHKRLQIQALIYLQMFTHQRSTLKIQKSVVVCILPRTKAFVNFPLK